MKRPLDKELVLELARNKQWIDSRGRTLNMASMDPNHIRNCMRLLERKNVPAKDVLVAVFEHELELRGEDLPPDAQMEERWRKLCSVTRDLFRFYKREKGPAMAQRYADILDGLGVDVR